MSQDTLTNAVTNTFADDRVSGDTIRPAFVVGELYTESSGVARILCELANTMGRQGVPVTVYASECNGKGSAKHLLEPPSLYVGRKGRAMGRLAVSRPLKQQIASDMPSIDVIHHHSMWTRPNHYASAAARKRGKPVVFTAHGFLEPWALARSRWKKRLVAQWFQNQDLRRAACIQANSQPELANIRAYGLKNPVAVVPNGVSLPPTSLLRQRDALNEVFPELTGKRVALFLSRLHEKKGLAHLVQSWASLRQEYEDWHLLVVGPDDGFEQSVRDLIEANRLENSVTLAGVRHGQEKQLVFGAADLFVLPSFSEGFSMAVLEALSSALPVLITPGCNFDEVVEAGAGIKVAPTLEETRSGLQHLMQMSDEDRRAMGRCGRRLIEERYTWEQVAAELVSVYRWLIGGGARPSCVTLE